MPFSLEDQIFDRVADLLSAELLRNENAIHEISATSAKSKSRIKINIVIDPFENKASTLITATPNEGELK